MSDTAVKPQNVEHWELQENLDNLDQELMYEIKIDIGKSKMTSTFSLFMLMV
jgi:hypothetical protein